MNFCKSCLMPVDEDSKFCNNCGTSLTLEDSPEKFPDITTVEPYTPPTNEPQPHITVEETPLYSSIEKVDAPILAKIGLLFLAVALSPIGLTVGLVMMSGKERTYKALGQVMVIVSTIVLSLSALCCCALYFTSISALKEYGGFFY